MRAATAPATCSAMLWRKPPIQLSAKQKELLHEFESLSQQNNKPKAQSFVDRVKEFFGQ